VLEKPREADKAIKVSLHDISLNEQKIEDDPKYKHKKRKSWK
jgi:hypothetical protein